MFDFAWSELMVIAVVALVVIGPKDLPRVMRSLGKWASRARMVAREFQGSIDQMIRESELEEVRREVQKVAEINLDHEVKSAVDPGGEIGKALESTSVTASDPALAPPAAAGGTTAPEAAPAGGSVGPEQAPAPAAEGEHSHGKTPTPA
ncbi:MAG TPA: Sec-independent protein translocase protein TatB [Stellaceae bacterium]|nr:Sec-independent protein translocase protein TatB [Stellaceae bacterium]